jgi:hypothetical protein
MRWRAVREASMRLARRFSIAGPSLVVLLLLAIPVAFNAFVLFPEVEYNAPNHNDEVFHYLFIERADQAISAGSNPVDHWLPELELGFPQFLYYQNLPHLTIVALYRLFLRKISLLRLLNLVRYLLMVAFPITVYWSMRRMEFSRVSAAVAAAFAPMLSSWIPYSFDYDSYAWRGYGLFAQLCSMHLMFISTACVRRALQRGDGYCAAILASAAMVLSDLVYAYIFAILVVILWLLSIASWSFRGFLARLYRSTLRLSVIMGAAAVITAYQTIPFLYRLEYVNLASLRNWRVKTLAPAAGHVARHLTFNLFDEHRLPVFALLVLLGVLYGIIKRPKGAGVAVGVLAGWSIVFFFPLLRRFLPLIHILPFVRLVAGVDFGAILTAGLGGELLWVAFRSRPGRLQTIGFIVLFSILYAPAILERWDYFVPEKAAIETTTDAFESDQDLARIFSTLRANPPGRVYAGTRANWGDWMGDADVHVFDLLADEQFDTVMPWQTLSLNSPYLWQLATPGINLCRLYNIRYVITPPVLDVPKDYRVLLSTERYVLYTVDSGGYAQLGQVDRIAAMGSSERLYESNRNWLTSSDPWESRFTAFVTPDRTSDPRADGITVDKQQQRVAGLGKIEHEVVGPDSIRVEVDANSAAVLIFKISYHPNWHVFVDGRAQPAFMVSPSFLATAISSPGRHEVEAEYRSSSFKKGLMGAAAAVLLLMLIIRVLGLDESIIRSGHAVESDRKSA